VGRPARGVLLVRRSQRLRAGEFEAIFRQRGRREELESFIALWRPCPGEGKVGFAVGRRLGGAVERNRARRRLREAYRQERPASQERFDVVFVGRSALLSRSFGDLRRDIQRVLRTLARRAHSGSSKSVNGGTEA
jgi:ribonuclease P protein component